MEYTHEVIKDFRKQRKDKSADFKVGDKLNIVNDDDLVRLRDIENLTKAGLIKKIG